MKINSYVPVCGLAQKKVPPDGASRTQCHGELPGVIWVSGRTKKQTVCEIFHYVLWLDCAITCESYQKLMQLEHGILSETLGTMRIRRAS